MSKPICTGINVQASSGGKVQLVQYKLDNNFMFSHQEQWSLPEDWSLEQVEAFKIDRTVEIKKMVDEAAQREQDALLDQSDWFE